MRVWLVPARWLLIQSLQREWRAAPAMVQLTSSHSSSSFFTCSTSMHSSRCSVTTIRCSNNSIVLRWLDQECYPISLNRFNMEALPPPKSNMQKASSNKHSRIHSPRIVPFFFHHRSSNSHCSRNNLNLWLSRTILLYKTANSSIISRCFNSNNFSSNY